MLVRRRFAGALAEPILDPAPVAPHALPRETAAAARVEVRARPARPISPPPAQTVLARNREVALNLFELARDARLLRGHRMGACNSTASFAVKSWARPTLLASGPSTG